MSNMSLLILPPEVIHRIFDYSDIQTIICSIRRVCKTLYNIVNIYNRFELTFNSKLVNIMKSLAPLVRPENVIALTISNTSDKNVISSFYSLFHGHEFTRLCSLTLYENRDTALEQVLEKLSTPSLTSLVIESNEREHSKTWSLVSSALVRWNLRKLCMTNMNYMMKHVSWPAHYSLQQLVFCSCTYSEYLLILHQLPYLRTLTMANCTVNDTDGKLLTSSTPTFHASLKSLTITDCSLSAQYFELLLKPINALRNLKLVSRKRNFDSMFDGCCWEEIIRIKLPYLDKFEFFFSHSNIQGDNFISLESLIAPFRTAFWLNDKQWFVSCAAVFSSSAIWLHTTPINIHDIGRSVRCEISWMDNVRRVTSRNLNTMVDTMSDKVCKNI